MTAEQQQGQSDAAEPVQQQAHQQQTASDIQAEADVAPRDTRHAEPLQPYAPWLDASPSVVQQHSWLAPEDSLLGQPCINYQGHASGRDVQRLQKIVSQLVELVADDASFGGTGSSASRSDLWQRSQSSLDGHMRSSPKAGRLSPTRYPGRGLGSPEPLSMHCFSPPRPLGAISPTARMTKATAKAVGLLPSKAGASPTKAHVAVEDSAEVIAAADEQVARITQQKGAASSADPGLIKAGHGSARSTLHMRIRDMATAAFAELAQQCSRQDKAHAVLQLWGSLAEVLDRAAFRSDVSSQDAEHKAEEMAAEAAKAKEKCVKLEQQLEQAKSEQEKLRQQVSELQASAAQQAEKALQAQQAQRAELDQAQRDKRALEEKVHTLQAVLVQKAQQAEQAKQAQQAKQATVQAASVSLTSVSTTASSSSFAKSSTAAAQASTHQAAATKPAMPALDAAAQQAAASPAPPLFAGLLSSSSTWTAPPAMPAASPFGSNTTPQQAPGSSTGAAATSRFAFASGGTQTLISPEAAAQPAGGPQPLCGSGPTATSKPGTMQVTNAFAFGGSSFTSSAARAVPAVASDQQVSAQGNTAAKPGASFVFGSSAAAAAAFGQADTKASAQGAQPAANPSMPFTFGGASAGASSFAASAASQPDLQNNLATVAAEGMTSSAMASTAGNKPPSSSMQSSMASVSAAETAQQAPARGPAQQAQQARITTRLTALAASTTASEEALQTLKTPAAAQEPEPPRRVSMLRAKSVAGLSSTGSIADSLASADFHSVSSQRHASSEVESEDQLLDAESGLESDSGSDLGSRDEDGSASDAESDIQEEGAARTASDSESEEALDHSVQDDDEDVVSVLSEESSSSDVHPLDHDSDAERQIARRPCIGNISSPKTLSASTSHSDLHSAELRAAEAKPKDGQAPHHASPLSEAQRQSLIEPLDPLPDRLRESSVKPTFSPQRFDIPDPDTNLDTRGEITLFNGVVHSVRSMHAEVKHELQAHRKGRLSEAQQTKQQIQELEGTVAILREHLSRAQELLRSQVVMTIAGVRSVSPDVTHLLQPAPNALHSAAISPALSSAAAAAQPSASAATGQPGSAAAATSAAPAQRKLQHPDPVATIAAASPDDMWVRKLAQAARHSRATIKGGQHYYANGSLGKPPKADRGAEEAEKVEAEVAAVVQHSLARLDKAVETGWMGPPETNLHRNFVRAVLTAVESAACLPGSAYFCCTFTAGMEGAVIETMAKLCHDNALASAEDAGPVTPEMRAQALEHVRSRMAEPGAPLPAC